jgi:hypothetical protein
VILCTGFTHNLGTFSDDLKAQYELPSREEPSVEREKLDAWAEQEVDRLLPMLKYPPEEAPQISSKRPCRLYRQLISPTMAAKGDRSIYFPGLIHSVYTPLVSELQALWGVAFMLDRLDLPDLKSMVEQTAVWNAWTSKRYLEQGRKHAYSIYDYLAVRSLSFSPFRAYFLTARALRSMSTRLRGISASKRTERATPSPRCLPRTDRVTIGGSLTNSSRPKH